MTNLRRQVKKLGAIRWDSFQANRPSVAGRRVVALIFSFYLSSCSPAFAAEINFDRLADAIYLAEGGSHTAHPYGILVHYRHTSPRQACINTCKHKYRQWALNGKKGAYLDYLASKYAPIGAENDNGTNQYWARNVKGFLK